MDYNRSSLPNVEVLLGVMVKTSRGSPKISIFDTKNRSQKLSLSHFQFNQFHQMEFSKI